MPAQLWPELVRQGVTTTARGCGGRMCAIISLAHRFVDDDTGYKRWLAEHPEQFVVNLTECPRRVTYVSIERRARSLVER